MKTKITSLILPAALACCLTTSAFAQMTNVTIDVDGGSGSGGESFQVAMMKTSPDSNLWTINDAMTNWTDAENRTFVGTNASFAIKEITYSENPFITFDFSVTDTGADSTFSLGFTTPITLAAGPTEVFSSIGGSITDGSASLDGVTLTPDSTTSSLLTAAVDSTPNSKCRTRSCFCC